jgi:hypothetical protein
MRKTVITLIFLHHGVTELATANEKGFGGFGFHKVWNPLGDESAVQSQS